MSGAVGAMLFGNLAPGAIQGIIPGTQTATGAFSIGNAGAQSCGTSNGNWVLPATAAVAAYYQVKVTVTSGAFTSGDVTGSFLDCSTSRSWTRTGSGTVTFDVVIREKATGTIRGGGTGIQLIIV